MSAETPPSGMGRSPVNVPGPRVTAVFYNEPELYPPIINSARVLAREGFRLALFCRDEGERWGVEYPPGVSVERIGARLPGSWRNYLAFVSAVVRRVDSSSDLFVGHDMHGLLPARILATRYRRPLVYHCHDFAEAGRALPAGSRLVRIIERLIARTADLVIVPDAERAVVVARQLRLGRQPTVVANSPLEAPAPGDPALRDALAARGVRFTKTVVRQGRIGPNHGIEPTVRSLPSWASREWGFVLFGIAVSEFRERVERLAAEMGVAHQLVVLPPVSYDDASAITAGGDVGHALYEPSDVNHALNATASNKVTGYMAAGLPVLASADSAIGALVERHRCGVTANTESPDSIAHAANGLLGDPERARRLGNAGRAAFDGLLRFDLQFAPVLSELRRLAASGWHRGGGKP